MSTVAVEFAPPGPVVAVLGADRVTTGLAVLERHLVVWPLVLALMLVAGGVEHTRSADRVSWARALTVAAGVGVLAAGLVLGAGLARGWAATPPIGLDYGLPWVFVLGAVVASTMLRGRLVGAAAVSGIALAVTVVASWVMPLGDPVAGLLASSWFWTYAALLVTLVEVTGRALVRRVLGRPVTA